MKYKSLYIFIYIFLIPFTSILSQPTAQLTNLGEVKYCETLRINLQLDFQGEPSFGYVINLYNAKDNSFLFDIKDLESGEATNTFQYNKEHSYLKDLDSVNVVLERVFDNTIIKFEGKWDPNSVNKVMNQSFTIYIDHYPTVKLPEDNSAYCGLQYQFAQELTSLKNTCKWEVLEGLDSFDDINSPKAIFTAPSEGAYSIKYTEISGACEDSFDIINISFFDIPKGSITNVPSNLELCESADVPVELNLIGNSPWNITFKVGSQFSSTYTTSETTPSFELSAIGGESISINSIVDKNGCFATDLQGEIITTDITPTPDAGNDQIICGSEVVLNASNPKGTGSWSIFNGGNGNFTNPLLPSTSFSIEDTYGEYTLIWTESINDFQNQSCESSDEVLVTFDKVPETVNAGEDLSIYLSNTLELNADIPDVGYGFWTKVSGLGTIVDSMFYKSTIENIEFGESVFKWTVINGICPANSDSVKVYVKGLDNPNGFSPNGDGINDQFEIGGSDKIMPNHILIFDKNGRIVFEQENYGSDKSTLWNGNDLDGNNLPTGVYYYVFTGTNSEGKEITPIKEYIILKTK